MPKLHRIDLLWTCGTSTAICTMEFLNLVQQILNRLNHWSLRPSSIAVLRDRCLYMTWCCWSSGLSWLY